MSTSENPVFLKNVLLFDAAACAVMGAALTLGASTLATLTSIPEGLLLYAGIVLFPIAAFMAVVTPRAPRSPWATWLIVAGNGLWVAGSLWLIFGGAIAPNAAGYALIAVQALAVALLAILEYVALRRLRGMAAA